MITLFPDQQTSVDAVGAAMRRRVKYVLMQGATGSGKSIQGAFMIQRSSAKGNKAWFIVPRRELIFQMSETFRDFQIDHSFIASGYLYDPFALVHVCSSGTLVGRLDKLTAPAIAFIDETHFGNDTLDVIIQWLKAAGTYIVGLSATPWKMNGEGLGKWYDAMVCGPKIKWLIENQRLQNYRYFAPSSPDLSGVRITAGDYNQKDLSGKLAADNARVGNMVEHYKKNAMGRRGITFGVSIDDSQKIAESYRAAGVTAMHIDGKTPDDERRRIAKAFARREILQLCCNDLLVFGWDLAAASGIKDVVVECMSDGQPTKSVAKQKQKNGRNLRYDKFNRDPHLFFDHSNNLKEHGYPCEEPTWTLSDQEKGSGNSNIRLLPVKQCEKCFYCETPKPACSNCGFEHPIAYREISEVAGDLIELSPEERTKIRVKEERECKTLKDFIDLGESRGYEEPVLWAKRKMNFKEMGKNKTYRRKK